MPELEPPPFQVEEFDAIWRKWFNRVYERIRGPLWDDELATLSDARTASGAPGSAVINGGPYIGRTFAVGDALQVAFHIRHSIKPGSKIYPHVHWCTDGTNAADVTWRFHHQIAKGYNQEAFPTASTIDVADTAHTTEWMHQITETSDAQAFTAPEVDSLIFMVIELESASGLGAPADKVFAAFVDLHYQKDRFGTPQRNGPNFYKY